MLAPNQLLIIAFAFALSAQEPAQKQFVNEREFNLHQRAFNERDSLQRIAALLEWEGAFPNSDFQRERSVMLALAYKGAGESVKAFGLARELLRSDSRDLNMLYLVVTVAPSLDASQDQVRFVEQAARDLLSRASELDQLASIQKSVVTDAAPEKPIDPESARLLVMLREWRGDRSRAPMSTVLKSAADSALAWAKSYLK